MQQELIHPSSFAKKVDLANLKSDVDKLDIDKLKTVPIGLIDLIANKTIKIPLMVIVVKTAFYENNKYYPQVFLDECLHGL